MARDIIVLNVASENPNKVKVTSLQLIVLFFNSFKRSSGDKSVGLPLNLHTRDSLKNPCSIPK